MAPNLVSQGDALAERDGHDISGHHCCATDEESGEEQRQIADDAGCANE